MHLPSWTNSRATLLPQNRDLPVSKGFGGLRFEFRQNFDWPLVKTYHCHQLSLILAHLGLFCPISTKRDEKQNAHMSLFHDPNSILAVIAVTLPFTNDWWQVICTPLDDFVIVRKSVIPFFHTKSASLQEARSGGVFNTGHVNVLSFWADGSLQNMFSLIMISTMLAHEHSQSGTR